MEEAVREIQGFYRVFHRMRYAGLIDQLDGLADDDHWPKPMQLSMEVLGYRRFVHRRPVRVGWSLGGQLRVKFLFSFFGPDLIISGSPAPRPLHVWKPKAREGSRSTS